jgi:hypothetical protein
MCLDFIQAQPGWKTKWNDRSLGKYRLYKPMEFEGRWLEVAGRNDGWFHLGANGD